MIMNSLISFWFSCLILFVYYYYYYVICHGLQLIQVVKSPVVIWARNTRILKINWFFGRHNFKYYCACVYNVFFGPGYGFLTDYTRSIACIFFCHSILFEIIITLIGTFFFTTTNVILGISVLFLFP